jgi:predicted phosphoribosyltransferase
MNIVFEDRIEAGQFLANKLVHYAHRADVIVLGLPRGGVPVAFQVAQALRAPLDVFIVRKLGVPGYEELAMGAMAMGGVRFLNNEILHSMDIAKEEVDAVVYREYQELVRREELYRGDRPAPLIKGQIAILVDDGLATGASMWAAVVALRKFQPAKIVVAVPVAAEQTCAVFRHEVDEIVCGITPDPFMAVGVWYKNFSQTTDDEVRDYLQRAPQPALMS